MKDLWMLLLVGALLLALFGLARLCRWVAPR
jgi:hypothetical protein